MKTRLQNANVPSLLVAMFVGILITACKDDEKLKLIPELTTAAVTDITTTTAMGGGEITSDGNDAVTVSGLVYSSTNSTPTIADSKTELIVATGSFTSNLDNLRSGTTYHVRAYATNSVGTGYGSVVDFSTGNAAPVASAISIAGTVRIPETLTATYTYADAENDSESGSTFQWYIATDGAGTGETAISGATALVYTLKAADEFKYLRIGIKPKSATGTTTSAEVKSAYVGPVQPEPTTVTFTYNGATVTYGILTSTVTGRKWLDRNLGAPNTPNAYNDFANYGDAFQWGRGADGHQLTNRGATSGTTTGVNGITTTLSVTDTPGHSSFIVPSSGAYDWRATRNDNLWQGVNGTNNPCPAGWRIPTLAEWQAEKLSNFLSVAYTQLKITGGGWREGSNGNFQAVSVDGFYATTNSWFYDPYYGAVSFYFSTFDVEQVYEDMRAHGYLCRCTKD